MLTSPEARSKRREARARARTASIVPAGCPGAVGHGPAVSPAVGAGAVGAIVQGLEVTPPV